MSRVLEIIVEMKPLHATSQDTLADVVAPSFRQRHALVTLPRNFNAIAAENCQQS
jgi:hypothetical protein